jgi:glycosyltransferase involved in cell wall biosynthesis
MKLGWPVEITGTHAPTFGYRTLAGNLRAALTALGTTWVAEGPAVILHVCPAHLFLPVDGMPNALLTMWEADQLPPDVVTAANRADLVLVPCRQNARAFRWSGVRRPIRVVPLGLGEAHTVPAPPKRTVGPGAPFRFLWVGQPNVRKGFDLVAEAFVRAFPDPAARVALTFKTNTNGAPVFHVEHGRVAVIAEPYDEPAMAALYRSAHAFVFPTRGEGFGLPVLEAMAAECLVLAPPIGGVADLIDPATAWLLDWRMVMAEYGIPVSVPEVPVGVLISAMQAAVFRYAETAALRARARARALTFTWAQTAAGVLAALAPLEAARPELAPA